MFSIAAWTLRWMNVEKGQQKRASMLQVKGALDGRK